MYMYVQSLLKDLHPNAHICSLHMYVCKYIHMYSEYVRTYIRIMYVQYSTAHMYSHTYVHYCTYVYMYVNMYIHMFGRNEHTRTLSAHAYGTLLQHCSIHPCTVTLSLYCVFNCEYVHIRMYV